MSLAVSVPEIAITPEAEEDDDHNFLNLAEALTDVEELFEETKSTKKHSYKKKLKIKVNENDGYTTALEDIEASDDEDTTTIKKHVYPITLDKYDLEQYSAEENCGVAKKNSETFQYFNMQSCMSNETLSPMQTSGSFCDLPALTDVEDYDTESEVEENDIPDTDLQLDNGEGVQTVKISDEIQDKTQSLVPESCITPHTSTHFPISLFEESNTKPRAKRAPTFSQMMRAKARSGENKIRRKKRNNTNARKCNNLENNEDADSSENETVKPEYKRSFISMNSLNYESDLEEENKLPFPVCKKTFTNTRNILVPEFDTNNITDVEDFECDTDISRRRVSVDNSMFQIQLDEMASCYSFTKDKNETQQKKCEKIENDKPNHNVNDAIKRKEVKSQVNFVENVLLIPSAEEDGATDIENIASSSENEESDVDGKQELLSDTDEQSFQDNIPIDNNKVPEIALPPTTRSLIIFEENKSLVPTVRILPLDDNFPTDSETEGRQTEDESFNSDKDIHENEEYPLSPCSELYSFEGGSVNVSENCIQPRHNRGLIEEEVTDIEELDAMNQKEKKEKKSMKSGKYLIPKNVISSELTDVEDLDMSDEKSGNSKLSIICSEMDGHTDVENLESSEDEPVKSDISKNKSDTKMLTPPILILPGQTDTEEMAGSTDDEVTYSRAETATPHELRRELDNASSIQVNIESSSKIDFSAPEEVMYLKGGGFQEMLTDTEEFFYDIDLQLHDVMEAWEYFHQGDDKVAKQNTTEWGATKGDLIDESRCHPETVREETKVVTACPISSCPTVSYDSVLVSEPSTMFRNEYLHKINSYTQIDEMLEKMLTDIEQIDTADESCMNSFTLEPSPNALIEIPIKKSKSRKTYTTTADLFVSEADNVCKVNLTDDELQIIGDNLLTNSVKSEDLESTSNEYLDSSYKYDVLFGGPNTASSESLDDISRDFNIDSVENFYEPIDIGSSYHVDDQKDIWWEGTYRNLSVVLEEDEENLSQAGSRPETSSRNTYDLENFDCGTEFPIHSDELSVENFPEYWSESSQIRSSVSTDDSDNETYDNIIKAEVKLLVTSQQDGIDSVEVKSVKELKSMEIRDDLKATESKSPGKLSRLTNKFSNIWDKRKPNYYSTLPTKQNKSDNKKAKNKPTFTLPRIFIRSSDSEGNSSSYKVTPDGDGRRIIAKPNENFPLTFTQSSVYPKLRENKVDLYANIPFYPTYKYVSSEVTTLTPLKTQYVPPTDVTISEGYCNWFPETEFSRGKTTSTQYLDKVEEKLLDKTVDPSVVSFPNTEIIQVYDFKQTLNETNAFIQSESKAEPYDKWTDILQKSPRPAIKSPETERKDKKSKKGFLGSLKSFVSKSGEKSDSESEKSSPKKEKKDKKLKVIPEPSPALSKKPRLPTPPESVEKNIDESILKKKIQAVNIGELEKSDKPTILDANIQVVESLAKIRPETQMNIDKSIDEIEGDILGKSPIRTDIRTQKFSEESSITESLPTSEQFWVVDSKPMLSHASDHFVSKPEYLKTNDVKFVTASFIQNEMSTAPDASTKYGVLTMAIQQNEGSIQEHLDNDESSEKHSKKSPVSSQKSSKDTENSEESEIIEKQDKEVSKESPKHSEKRKKSGLLGFLTRKSKKDSGDASEIDNDLALVQDKAAENHLEEIKSTSRFLLGEKQLYEDAASELTKMYDSKQITTSDTPKHEGSLLDSIMEKSETAKTLFSKLRTTDDSEKQKDISYVKFDDDDLTYEAVNIAPTNSVEKQKKVTFENISDDTQNMVEPPIPPEKLVCRLRTNIPEVQIQDQITRVECDDFLNNEKIKYDDVMLSRTDPDIVNVEESNGVVSEKLPAVVLKEVEVSMKKSKGIFGFLGKKEQDIKDKRNHTEEEEMEVPGEKMHIVTEKVSTSGELMSSPKHSERIGTCKIVDQSNEDEGKILHKDAMKSEEKISSQIIYEQHVLATEEFLELEKELYQNSSGKQRKLEKPATDIAIESEKTSKDNGKEQKGSKGKGIFRIFDRKSDKKVEKIIDESILEDDKSLKGKSPKDKVRQKTFGKRSDSSERTTSDKREKTAEDVSNMSEPHSNEIMGLTNQFLYTEKNLYEDGRLHSEEHADEANNTDEQIQAIIVESPETKKTSGIIYEVESDAVAPQDNIKQTNEFVTCEILHHDDVKYKHGADRVQHKDEQQSEPQKEKEVKSKGFFNLFGAKAESPKKKKLSVTEKETKKLDATEPSFKVYIEVDNEDGVESKKIESDSLDTGKEQGAVEKSSTIKSLFKIFDKKKDGRQIEIPESEGITKTENVYDVSDKKFLKLTNDFLEMERTLYHDVRNVPYEIKYNKIIPVEPFSEEKSPEKEVKLRTKDKNKDTKTKGLFQIFNRRSQDREISEKIISNQNSDENPQNREIESNKKSQKDGMKILESSAFIQEGEQPTDVKTEIPFEEKMYYSVKNERSENKTDVEDISVQKTATEEIITKKYFEEIIKPTNDFLITEQNLYHDVKFILPEGDEKENKVTMRKHDFKAEDSQSKGFFKLFNRRSQEKEVSEKEMKTGKKPKLPSKEKPVEEKVSKSKGVFKIFGKKPDSEQISEKRREETTILQEPAQPSSTSDFLKMEKELYYSEKYIKIEENETQTLSTVTAELGRTDKKFSQTGDEDSKVSGILINKKSQEKRISDAEIQISKNEPAMKTAQEKTEISFVKKIDVSMVEDKPSVTKTDSKSESVQETSTERIITDKYIEEIINPTNEFLTTEQNLYHDVKFNLPGGDQKFSRLEYDSDTKSKKDNVKMRKHDFKEEHPQSGGFFKLFNRRSQEREVPEKDLQTDKRVTSPHKEKSVEEKVPKSKGVFKIFGKKPDSEGISEKNQKESTVFQESAQLTFDFLKIEKELYYSEKYIKAEDDETRILSTVTAELDRADKKFSEKGEKDSKVTGIFKIFNRKSQEKEISVAEKAISRSKPEKEISALKKEIPFGKKIDISVVKDKPSENKPDLKSESVQKNSTEGIITDKYIEEIIKPTNDFLITEQNLYHDVKFILPGIDQQVSSHENDSDTKLTEDNVKVLKHDFKEEDSQSKGFFKLFNRRSQEKEVSEKEPKTDKRVTSPTKEKTVKEKVSKTKGVAKIFGKKPNSEEISDKKQDEKTMLQEIAQPTSDFLQMEKKLYYGEKFIKTSKDDTITISTVAAELDGADRTMSDKDDKDFKATGIFRIFNRKSEVKDAGKRSSSIANGEIEKNILEKQSAKNVDVEDNLILNEEFTEKITKRTNDFLNMEKSSYCDSNYNNISSNERKDFEEGSSLTIKESGREIKNSDDPQEKYSQSKSIFRIFSKKPEEKDRSQHENRVPSVAIADKSVTHQEEILQPSSDNRTIEELAAPKQDSKKIKIFNIFSGKTVPSETTLTSDSENNTNKRNETLLNSITSTSKFVETEKLMYHDAEYQKTYETAEQNSEEEFKLEALKVDTDEQQPITTEVGSKSKSFFKIFSRKSEERDVGDKKPEQKLKSPEKKAIRVGDSEKNVTSETVKRKGGFQIFKKKTDGSKQNKTPLSDIQVETEQQETGLIQPTDDFLGTEKKLYHDIKHVEAEPTFRKSEEIECEASQSLTRKTVDLGKAELENELNKSLDSKAKITHNENGKDISIVRREVVDYSKLNKSANEGSTTEISDFFESQIQFQKEETLSVHDVKDTDHTKEEKLFTDGHMDTSKFLEIEKMMYYDEKYFESPKADDHTSKGDNGVIIQSEKASEEKKDKASKETKSGRFFNIFGKKVEERPETKNIPEKTQEKIEEQHKRPVDMSLPKEVDKHSVENETSIHERDKKNSGLLKIFGKKDKKKSSVTTQSLDSESDKQIAEQTKFMTDEFLNTEKEIYEDVKPMKNSSSNYDLHELKQDDEIVPVLTGVAETLRVGETIQNLDAENFCESFEEKITKKKISNEEHGTEKIKTEKPVINDDMSQSFVFRTERITKISAEKSNTVTHNIEVDKREAQATTDNTVYPINVKEQFGTSNGFRIGGQRTSEQFLEEKTVATDETPVPKTEQELVKQFSSQLKNVNEGLAHESIPTKEEISDILKNDNTADTEAKALVNAEENQHKESLIKSPKKKGIFGFLKKKSHDDGSRIEPEAERVTKHAHVQSLAEDIDISSKGVSSLSDQLAPNIDAADQKSSEKSNISSSSITQESKKRKLKSRPKSYDGIGREEKGKGILGLFSRRSKSKDREDTESSRIKDEEVLNNMKFSKLFLEKETEMYHDVKLFCGTMDPKLNDNLLKVKQDNLHHVNEKELITEKSSKKGTGIFKFFKKKSKDESKPTNEVSKETEETKPLIDSASFIQTEIENFNDIRPVPEPRIRMTNVQQQDTSYEQETSIENKNIIDVPEFTAFDFIKEEIENFESAKLPFTETIDSSVRVETEIEDIDGDTPKEIITKRIIISERLVERPNQARHQAGTSEKILEELMNVNKELKSRITEHSEEPVSSEHSATQIISDIDDIQPIENFSLSGVFQGKHDIAKPDLSKTKVIIQDKVGSQERIENIKAEFAEEINDLELAKGDVVEDVSLLESQLRIYGNNSHDKITDLDEGLPEPQSLVNIHSVIGVTEDPNTKTTSVKVQSIKQHDRVSEKKNDTTPSDVFSEKHVFEEMGKITEPYGNVASPGKKGVITKLSERDNQIQDMDIIQVTEDFVRDLKIQYHPDESLPVGDISMTRTVSDNTVSQGKIDKLTETQKISETNIDLSTIRKNDDELVVKKRILVSSKSDVSPYVTSPTLVRRTLSQKVPNVNKPEVTEIRDDSSEAVVNTTYIVTDPDENISGADKHVDGSKRKPLFRLESDEDDFITSIKIERRDSAKSNILETLGDSDLDNLLSDLQKNLSDTEPVGGTSGEKREVITITYDVESNETDSKAEVELIEKKLSDLGKALDTLEKLNEIGQDTKDEKREKKLKRVERKFERMASEILEDTVPEQAVKSPDSAENKQYQQLVSQMSTDEVISFQNEYSNLWDDYTFSKSDEWDSKTPDSQADVLELPQGDIVYMAPVKLNKNNSVNKAGLEVDVIPIMPSPHASPKTKRKSRRSKSEMNVYGFQKKESSSLPKLGSLYLQESVTDKVLSMNPDRFLSTASASGSMHSSIIGDEWITRSLDNLPHQSEGQIMKAVVDWLESPSSEASSEKLFGYSTSENKRSGNTISKQQRKIPNIQTTHFDMCRYNTMPQNTATTLHRDNYLDVTCKQLTEAPQKTSTNIHTPQPKPRHQKSKEIIEEHNQETNQQSKQISPVRDDLLDEKEQVEEISYQDKKKFWETISKEPSQKTPEPTLLAQKRKSIQETSIAPIPKPRGALQFSYSVAETQSEKNNVVKTIETETEFDNNKVGLPITETLKEHTHTEIQISERDIPKTEYQASFVSPIDRKESRYVEETIHLETETLPNEDAVPKEPTAQEPNAEIKKSDSCDSESDGSRQNSSQEGDNAGYISDCGDVEHYISDSEIEDRVPQIRERQMSVFVPPSVSQRTRYERSASLPTEDLYEVSARSTKLRKQYYEEQIKKEMIKEQLTIDLEDDASPERKSIGSSSNLVESKDIESIEIIDNESSLKDDLIRQSPTSRLLERTSTDEYPEETVTLSANNFPNIPNEDLMLYEHVDNSTCEIERNQPCSTDLKTESDLKKEFVEVHVDKSETEKSEKFTGRGNDRQTPTIKKSPEKEKIPEIILNLSGLQRRISEEIDEYAPRENETNVVPPEQPEITVSLSGLQKRISEEEDQYAPKSIEENETSTPEQPEIKVTLSGLQKRISEEDDPYTPKVEDRESSSPEQPKITVTLSGLQKRISEEDDQYAPKNESVNISPTIPEHTEGSVVVDQPEENVTNTIWEVSVESETLKEEKLTSLPSIPSSVKRGSLGDQSDSLSEKLIEKEEDLSSDVRDESDLGSEIHQDHSDSYASDKIKSESHSDMKKIILDSLHQQQVDPEEAKLIANSLIEEIESEIQKVENFNNGLRSKSDSLESEKQHVTDYLKELAEAKGLDQREVELVESVLERRQRQIFKLNRGDTQASSMEITDEDLRYSEGDLDYSHVLAQQMGQLEAEYSDNLKNVYESLVQDQDVITSKVCHEYSSDKISHDCQNVDDDNSGTSKRDKQIKTNEVISCEKSYKDTKNVIMEEDETISESITEDSDKTNVHMQANLKESIQTEDERKKYERDTEAIVNIDIDSQSQAMVDHVTRESSQKVENIIKAIEHSMVSSEVKENNTNTEEMIDKYTGSTVKVESKIESEAKERSTEQKTTDSYSIQKISDTGLKSEKIETSEQTQVQSATSFHQTQVESTHELISKEFNIGKEERIVDCMKRTSSSDSKSSAESAKSPEELFSTCSSSKKADSEPSQEVIFRKSKTDSDSCISKSDRKSGLELETYSSSGESHYHSFEIDGKSRPCSSDIEGIIPTGSSEYESALNSQELSARSQLTSGEYHTAVSSLSSKESMRSFESESSGNLGSIEVSEASETLVPTNSDLEGDVDIVDQQIFDDTELLWPSNAEETEEKDIISTENSNDLARDPLSESDKYMDIPSKMKRSYEMTFQPEPKVLTADSPHTESNDIDERFGTSLDEGSVLSVSLSSTSSAQLRTVIELSRTESGGLEESLTTSAISDHISLDDVDSMLKMSDAVTPTQSSVQSILTDQSCQSYPENGTLTQVSTEIVTLSDKQKFTHDELKKKGHRRQESSSFIPSLIHGISKPPDTQSVQGETEISSYSEERNDTEVFGPKIDEMRELKFETTIQEKTMDLSIRREPNERRDSHGKSSTTSSEKSSFEEAEAEAAFNMVAHISPVHKIKQICPIIEDIDAEKKELEAKERSEKERQLRASQMKDASPGSIPDIKVTEHLAPLDESNFRYPELEMERKELQQEKSAESETPISNSSKSSEDTDQGREYILDERNVISEENEASEDKQFTESRSETSSAVEKTLNDGERATDSPNSDSFELVEKPDIIDDFVVIEEVGKEASEMDSEGKSVTIQVKPKRVKKHDEEIDAYLAKSDPTPLTKMTELKYFPESSNDELEFEFEDSPPQQKDGGEKSKDYGLEYDRELEANRKWIEQQFHGDQAAMAAAGYGYEMEFERGPLEDIKEEDINDFDMSSSRIGSLGSQKESGGSLGSVKDSYSSTPEYDVLAGRKYFTKSGEHDDVSMSSLQEFENLERAMSLETKKFHHGSGSQDSSSNGSFKTRYYANKGQGDDISVSSLKEFEGLEKACIAVYKTEIKVKEEEELLSHIEEAPESISFEIKKSEEIVMEDKKKIESDEEDYEKRMFEIDEIIRQAQNNVERFIDLKEADKTESLGRGDSVEEVSKVPDLDLDAPITKPITKEKWKDDDPMVTSTDSLDLNKDNKPQQYNSTDSLDQKLNEQDIMTASTDSIEFNNQRSKENMTTDSFDGKGEGSHMVCSDSLEIAATATAALQADSLDDDEPKICYDHSSSDTGKDFSSSVRDDGAEHDDHIHDLMLGSTDSLEPTSSAATHATYQYETDSVFSGSFTSGGSNTMVSSTDTIDPTISKDTVDIAAAVRKVWFDEEAGSSGKNITTEFFHDSTMPYVTEVIEPSNDPGFSHTIHRRVELPPEVRKVTFHGKGADERLQQFINDFGESEEVHETEEIDADGNVHVRRVVQKRYIIKSDDVGESSRITTGQHTLGRVVSDSDGNKTTYSQQFEQLSPQLTALTKTLTGDSSFKPSGTHETSTLRDQSQESSSSKEGESQSRQQPLDQHQLSDEMKELLKEMEKTSKQ